MSDEVSLNVNGMTCAHCAQGIENHLKKLGAKDARVDFSTSMAFVTPNDKLTIASIISEITKLGYEIDSKQGDIESSNSNTLSIEKKFFISFFFTLPLLLHMFLPFKILHDQYFQLALTIPVFLIGFFHFGRSALGSLKIGAPNMDVLIIIGTSSAFIYSLTGTLLSLGHNYLFYESSASIITIVLLGNLLERRAVKKTTSAIEDLGKIQAYSAKKISIVNGVEQIEEVSLKKIALGDTILVNSGDKIPTDGEVIWGSGSINESMLTGESLPVEKTQGSQVVGGSILLNGSIKFKAQAVGENTVLANIIRLVRDAQRQKPRIQRLGDLVSNIFVPVVLFIALATFLISFFAFGISFQNALLNSIAVLVVACPCAMGLATPTAVMVGVGRAVKQGILIKGGETLERLATIHKIAFDKTGTLTTGEFKIKEIRTFDVDEDKVRSIIFSIEKHSSHPIAKSLTNELRNSPIIEMNNVWEEKGLGMHAVGPANEKYTLGSYQTARNATSEDQHSLYLLENNKLIAWLDIEDQIVPGAKGLIANLKSLEIVPIIISGDTQSKVNDVASKLEIEETYAQQTPKDKLSVIEDLQRNQSIAFVGDGINDAPALTKATIGISLSNATDVAIQSAQVVLVGGKLQNLEQAIKTSRLTFRVIKQNLFWAFIYNIIAIPFAACGYLTPTVAAFAMAFSDLCVIVNSLRLRTLGDS